LIPLDISEENPLEMKGMTGLCQFLTCWEFEIDLFNLLTIGGGYGQVKWLCG